MQRRIHALFLYLLLMFLEIAFPQKGEDLLPQPGECGTLNKAYMYNQKNITELDEFPWMGRIAHRMNESDDTRFLCAAVLISKYHLLTNANCFRYEEQAYAVLLGDWNMTNNVSEPDCEFSDKGPSRCAPIPVLYEIAEIIVNLNYTPKIKADNIALLRLAEPVVYSSYIRPICLPSLRATQLNLVSFHLTLTGWSSKIRDEPRKSKKFVHVVCQKTCAKWNKVRKTRYKQIFHKNNSLLCASSCSPENKWKYTGGSALMGVTTLGTVPYYYYLIGLIAYGRLNCSKIYPDLFVRINEGHLDWVKENLYL